MEELKKMLVEWKEAYDAMDEHSTEEELDRVEYLQEQICLKVYDEYCE